MGHETSSIRSHWPISILSTLASVVNTLLPLILVRIISAEEVGIFKVFFLYLAIMPAFSLTTGLFSGLAYWAGQEQKTIPVYRTSVTMVLLASTVMGGLLLLGGNWIAQRLGWPTFHVQIFALALGASITATFLEEATVATGRIWAGALFYSGFEVLRTLTIIGAVVAHPSVEAVLVSHTAVVSIKAVCALLYGARLGFGRPGLDFSLLHPVWAYALPVSVASMMGVFVNTADQFILSLHIPPAAFAFYAIGCLSIQPLFILEQSVTRVLIPQLSAAFSRGAPGRAATLYREAVGSLAFLLIPAVAGLVVFATPIIEILFTTRYSSASQYLQLFAFTYLTMIIPHDAVARALGESSWILKTFTLFSFISLGSAALLAYLFGPFGALSAVLFSRAALRVYTMRYMQRRAGWRLSSFLPIPLLIESTLLSVFLALCALALQPLFSSSWIWFGVCGTGFAALYFVLSILLRNADLRRRPTRHVLMLTQSLCIGGLERMVLHLSKALEAQHRWHVEVVAYDHGEGEHLCDQFRNAGIPVTTFRKQRGFSPRTVLRILRVVLRSDTQVLHVHDLGALMYGALVKLLTLGRVRIVMTQHSFIHLAKNPRYRMYERLFTRFVDAVVVVSEDTRNTYHELGFARSRVLLIANGVQFTAEPVHSREAQLEARKAILESLPDHLRRQLEPLIEHRWVLYLARLFPQKGQERAVTLWSHLSDNLRAQSVLLFVGPESSPGSWQSLADRIVQLSAPHHVIWCGATTRSARWYAASDLFLSCSEFEGMPLAPLEAAGSGVPTVLSDIPGHHFLRPITQEFPLDDPASGARLVTAALEAPFEALRIGAWRAAQRLRDEFSVEAMAKRYAQVYEATLIGRRGRRDMIEVVALGESERHGTSATGVEALR